MRFQKQHIKLEINKPYVSSQKDRNTQLSYPNQIDSNQTLTQNANHALKAPACR
jgi:hypothetical protein